MEAAFRVARSVARCDSGVSRCPQATRAILLASAIATTLNGRHARSCEVSEKGAVSVYGMGRFPVTLYKEQWIKLLDVAEEIRAFIATNESQLKAKE
jgi:hypothetical protein